MSSTAEKLIERMCAEDKTASEVLDLQEKMKSMTYGKLPSQSEFDKAFDTEVDDDYSFKNDPRVGNDELNASQLWKELKKATKEWEGGDDEAGDWASSVLSTLGFEWI